jgi:hypothetical protein
MSTPRKVFRWINRSLPLAISITSLWKLRRRRAGDGHAERQVWIDDTLEAASSDYAGPC